MIIVSERAADDEKKNCSESNLHGFTFIRIYIFVARRNQENVHLIFSYRLNIIMHFHGLDWELCVFVWLSMELFVNSVALSGRFAIRESAIQVIEFSGLAYRKFSAPEKSFAIKVSQANKCNDATAILRLVSQSTESSARLPTIKAKIGIGFSSNVIGPIHLNTFV
jgi:hypothetical protein